MGGIYSIDYSTVLQNNKVVIWQLCAYGCRGQWWWLVTTTTTTAGDSGCWREGPSGGGSFWQSKTRRSENMGTSVQFVAAK